jgi:hypothetical protein
MKPHGLMRPWPKKLHVSVNLNTNQKKEHTKPHNCKVNNFWGGRPHGLWIFNETLEIKGFF